METNPTRHMKASAKANKPFGYKAIVVHPSGRTEVLGRKFALSADGRSMDQVRAGQNFPTRKEAVAYAEREIAFRAERDAIARFRLIRKPDGTRPTEDEARAALGYARATR